MSFFFIDDGVSLTLTYRGHGHAYQSSNTANLAAGYGSVDGGSSPVSGSLVVWIAVAVDTSSTPMVDLTGSGWSQQRTYTSPLGTSVLAKVLSGTDISSPPNMVVSPTNGSIGFWTAFDVAGVVNTLAVGSVSGVYSNATAPADQVVNSTGASAGAQVVSVGLGGGNNGSPNLTMTGGMAVATVTTPDNIWGSTLETVFRVAFDPTGVSVTFSKPDDGDGNHMASGYVAIS